MRNSLKELATILDEHIEKAEKADLVRNGSSIDRIEKSLSFNPFNPHEMGADSPYYNPYRQLADGTFAPYEASHWAELGKNPNDYLTTQQFYSALGESRHQVIEEIQNPSFSFRRSMGKVIDSLVKAIPSQSPSSGGTVAGSHGVPIGTVHTYRDGQRYKKVDQGKWVPMAGREERKVGDILTANPPAHQEMEAHASQTLKIQEALKQRQKERDLINQAKKEVLGHVKDTVGKLYDGDMPKEMGQHLDEAARGITPELREKVKRKGHGEGREVKLSKDEVTQLLKSGKYALISAGKNPNHEEDKNLDDATIASRYEKLRGDLVRGGYAFSKVTGHYGGVEDSFLVMVHDADKDHMKNLGKKYNQDSIIHADNGKQEMHFTTGKKEGVHHAGEGFKPAEGAEDMYSEIETADGPMKFQLNFDFQKEHGVSKEQQKKGKKHAVDVEFEQGGNKYKRTLNVTASNHSDAINSVIEGIKKKIPGAKINKIGASAATGREAGGSGGGAGDKGGSDDEPKAPGDKGRPDNDMGPPPPENSDFVKPGSQVTMDDVKKFVQEFHDDYVAMETVGEDLKKTGASHFANRLKDEGSLLNKINGRLKDRSLNTVADVIGARALATSLQDQKRVLDHIKKNFEIIEHEDYTAKPKAGYRAQHIIFKTDTGKLAEMQIKTLRQQVFSGFTHDTVYKIPKGISDEDKKALGGADVKAYLDKVSEHLYNLDQGKPAGERPQEPKILAKLGMKFPWADIDDIAKGNFETFDVKEKEQKQKYESWKVKHFVTVRDEDNNNLETKQFKNFDAAKTYRDKMRDQGHKGQLPMGYANSKKEYLQTFSEYKDSPKKPGVDK